MVDFEEDRDDRLLAYQSLSTSTNSLPSSAVSRLQGMGTGIVQRRYRMATESVLTEPQGSGIGLQALSRSRMATSPLMNLVEPVSSGILSKSVSFQSVPVEFTTRYIDEVKIQKHLCKAQSSSTLPLVAANRHAKRQAAYKAAVSFVNAMYWVTIFTGIFGLALSGTILFKATTSTWHKDFGKSPVFKTAAVASEQELCSKIGVGLLKRGGNAVDAAIGSLVCVGVINNFSSGIGGGGFMLIRVNDTYSTVIDYRETAPSGVSADDFGKDGNKLMIGGLSVAVPSQMKGLAMAHKKFGKLPWSDLFEPSMALCKQGFPVTAKLAKTIAKWAAEIEKSPAMRDTYLKKSDQHDSQKNTIDRWVPKTEADIILRPNLGETLEQIGSLGAETFWSGKIAEAIAGENRRAGGKLTVDDMKNYEPVERDPLIGTFKGFKVTTVGSPASGAPLLMILKLLEALQLRNGTSVAEKHLFVEALKFGYAARQHVGDPKFTPEILDKELAWLTEASIQEILEKIDRKQTHLPDYYTDVFGDVRDHGTTHLSILDRDGMAVSVTDTVNLEFGAFLMDGQTGVLQNNEMGDFSLAGVDNAYGLPPSKANYIKPGKRPVSSSTPIILEKNGQVVLVTGAAGGSRIISVTAQVIMDLLLFKLDPIKSMVDARIHHQLFPNEVIVDHETPEELIDGLIGYGHKVVVLPADTALTSLQLILKRRNGDIWALSDPRKGGLADGY